MIKYFCNKCKKGIKNSDFKEFAAGFTGGSVDLCDTCESKYNEALLKAKQALINTEEKLRKEYGIDD